MDRRSAPPGGSDEDEQQREQQLQQQQRANKSSPRPRRTAPLGKLPASLEDVTLKASDDKADMARAMPAMASPGMDLRRHSPVEGKARLAGSDTSPFSSSKARQVDLQNPKAFTWNLEDRNVQPLPNHFPLEQTAVFVPHTAAPPVAARISDVLRARSISAEYVNAKAKVKCVTCGPNRVEFRIRLFRGKNAYSHGIIVEVQRRYGFSLNFPTYIAAILDAAEGKPMPPPPPPSSIPPPPLPSLVPPAADSLEEEESDSAGLETIRIAAAMLSAPSVHQNIMGLEGLASLTDEYTIGTSTATRASAEILAGANPDSATVRDMILTLVAGGIYRSDSLPDLDDDLDSDDDDDDFGSSSSVDGSEYLRILALSVLVNVLERSEGSKGFLLNLRVPFEDMIVPALLRDLSRSDRDQESADLASAALIHLVRALGRDSAFLRDHLLAQGARDLLVKANFVGEACFENLRKRTALCLAELDSYSSLL